jgi:hypothetical protein
MLTVILTGNPLPAFTAEYSSSTTEKPVEEECALFIFHLSLIPPPV